MSKFENEKFFYDRTDYKEIEINGIRTKVYRIISKINFSTQCQTVVAGTKGGYCALGTLSEKGVCWVDAYSVVGPDCFVAGGAYIEHSLLAHDCSVGGRVYVYDSKIVPNAKASIHNSARVLRSDIKGDLNLKDEAEIFGSKIVGNLKMEAETKLTNCLLETEKGITIVGDKQLNGMDIKGVGTLGISDDISLSIIENSKTSKL